MIIDSHGHYTTAPKKYTDFHFELVGAASEGRSLAGMRPADVSDDEIRESLEDAQLRMQRERGTDITIFSPKAAGMSHHLGDISVSTRWAEASNDLIARVCELYPKNFVGAAQLPQSDGAGVDAAVRELRRAVNDLGFIGCNVNPDPSGGYWSGTPLTDKSWYPLWEAMVELDVPGMIHVSKSCNPNFHTTGGHYIAGDTTGFVQLMQSTLFDDFPTLRLIIPHGGGAVPYHWGRYRGLALDSGLSDLEEGVMKNVYFDTCVYHEPGLRLLTDVVPTRNIIFASEMVGAVRGCDPRTGRHFDDTKTYIDALELDAEARGAIFQGNAMRVFPRLQAALSEN